MRPIHDSKRFSPLAREAGRERKTSSPNHLRLAQENVRKKELRMATKKAPAKKIKGGGGPGSGGSETKGGGAKKKKKK